VLAKYLLLRAEKTGLLTSVESKKKDAHDLAAIFGANYLIRGR